jgi:hypothetical protein
MGMRTRVVAARWIRREKNNEEFRCTLCFQVDQLDCSGSCFQVSRDKSGSQEVNRDRNQEASIHRHHLIRYHVYSWPRYPISYLPEPLKISELTT